MSEERDGGDFVVIDKRAASGAAGDEPETAAPGPADGPQTGERDPHPSPPGGNRAASRGSASPAPADFAMLVQPFFVAALYHMGLAADPDTGQPGARNLPLARHNIDLLQVIEEKTRGNLDDDERHLLEGALYELRMSFVKVGKASGE